MKKFIPPLLGVLVLSESYSSTFLITENIVFQDIRKIGILGKRFSYDE